MRTPPIELRKVRFVIPSNIPGTISELKTGKLFSNIRAYNTANEVLTVEPYSMNEYEIIIHGQLARIEYDVHDSWHFQNGNLILPQIGTSFKPGTQFLLNFHALAGYIQGFEDFPFHVEIKKPHQLYTISGLDITMNDSIDIAEAEQGYLELIDNPILYSKEKERTFIVGKTKFKIGYYTEGVDNQSLTIEKVLKSVCESANAYCEGFTEKQYTFILNYVLPESDPFKAEEAFGAVEHSKSAVFYFPITNNMYKFERDLSYTCAHELMHLFGPLKMQTDVTSKINFRAKSQSENLWMYEGFTEYLSLQMLYQQELITETEFINEIRNKINLVNYTKTMPYRMPVKPAIWRVTRKCINRFIPKGHSLL
jgi:predicted metalloprotease with PDZ domain